MFLTDCLECGLRELRGARSIELLVNTAGAGGGIQLVYRCTRCDARDILGASGSAAGRRPVPAPVAA
jgi:hypothetical protein